MDTVGEAGGGQGGEKKMPCAGSVQLSLAQTHRGGLWLSKDARKAICLCLPTPQGPRAIMLLVALASI